MYFGNIQSMHLCERCYLSQCSIWLLHYGWYRFWLWLSAFESKRKDQIGKFELKALSDLIQTWHLSWLCCACQCCRLPFQMLAEGKGFLFRQCPAFLQKKQSCKGCFWCFTLGPLETKLCQALILINRWNFTQTTAFFFFF